MLSGGPVISSPLHTTKSSPQTGDYSKVTSRVLIELYDGSVFDVVKLIRIDVAVAENCVNPLPELAHHLVCEVFFQSSVEAPSNETATICNFFPLNLNVSIIVQIKNIILTVSHCSDSLWRKWLKLFLYCLPFSSFLLTSRGDEFVFTRN